MRATSDGYGNYVVTQNQSFKIIGQFIIWYLVSLALLSLAIYIKDGPSLEYPFFENEKFVFVFVSLTIFYTLIILTGLKTVPYKHYGVRTFGKPLKGNIVYEQGLHWIPFFYSFRKESIDPITFPYQLDNLHTVNNIIFSIKGSILYRMGNASLFSEFKTEAANRLKAGVENGVTNYIKTRNITERELNLASTEIPQFIFDEIEYLKDTCGIWIVKQSIEWVKPLNQKVVDNFAEEAKFDSQIKRIVSLAKELNINAEDAFKIEAIRIGLIKSNENILNLKGATEIIAAAASLLKK